MIPKRIRYIPLLVLTMLGCQSKKNQEPSEPIQVAKDTSITESASIPDEEPIPEIPEEEMVDEMEFMPPIESNSYFGIAIGDSTIAHAKVLRPGSLKSGEGQFPVNYILWNKDTLGYAYGENIIESIHIWDNRGTTYEGVRVGSTFAEIKQLLKTPKVHGSEIESRVHVLHRQHSYRLDYYDANYEIDISQIPDSVRVMEIVVAKN
ncbi:MAG: hypothetical protein AAGD88_16795 [Bacteroidota bacterium]